MTDTNKMAQYVANWQDERNGAALYRAISEVEKNPQLKKVYQRLAEQIAGSGLAIIHSLILLKSATIGFLYRAEVL